MGIFPLNVGQMLLWSPRLLRFTTKFSKLKAKYYSMGPTEYDSGDQEKQAPKYILRVIFE